MKLIIFLIVLAGSALCGEYHAKNILENFREAYAEKNVNLLIRNHHSSFKFKFCEKSGSIVSFIKYAKSLIPEVKSVHYLASKERFIKDNILRFDYNELVEYESGHRTLARGYIIAEFRPSRHEYKILEAVEDCPQIVNLMV